ncbi:Hsp20/alpha crystallin family protein [Burkholderia sp. Bp8963]|uniref:Hsp20/alpha crystallin family protein n=1 Tax=Burkholderia sp. Bp8963 TaxID=2184547 RepID=UPI000F59E564|nr:Hsp20/alpha crystallin family protein [Burkholderia sp. Bp8963]RQS63555.1 Hsp20/alpha crystallin family protein [Burkholderia sp. Bp8963]
MNDTTQLTQREQGAVTRDEREGAARPVTVVPAVDIFEDSQGITLWADLPGVTKDKLEVNVHDSSLSIEAQAVVPTPQDLRLQYAEVRVPHFARTFTLSPDFDTSRIDASLKDGVMKLSIPRREEARPRRIEIKAS